MMNWELGKRSGDGDGDGDRVHDFGRWVFARSILMVE